MSAKRTYLDRIGSEQLLVLFFLTVAAYMFLEAFSYSYAARVFPQITSSIVIVGCLLLLFRNHLPNFLRVIITESVDIASRDVSVDDETKTELDRFEKPVPPTTFTAILTFGYILAGLAVGFLWVTPVFIAVYLLWFGKPLPYVALTSLLGLLIGYGFITVFGIGLGEGMLYP